MKSREYRRRTPTAIAMVLALCMFTTMVFEGCGNKTSDPYQLAVSMNETRNRLYVSLEDALSFIEALKTFNLKENPEVFVDMVPSLEQGEAACQAARTQINEIESMGRELALEDLDGPLEKLGMRVEAFLTEVEEVTGYLYTLNGALEPWKTILKKTKDTSETGMDIKDANVPEVLARYDAFLSSQDEVLSSLALNDIPPQAMALHEAIIKEIKGIYLETYGLLLLIKSQATITLSADDTTVQETSDYNAAVGNLEQKLDVADIEKVAQPLEDLLFEYLVKYRPEAEE